MNDCSSVLDIFLNLTTLTLIGIQEVLNAKVANKEIEERIVFYNDKDFNYHLIKDPFVLLLNTRVPHTYRINEILLHKINKNKVGLNNPSRRLTKGRNTGSQLTAGGFQTLSLGSCAHSGR